MDLNERAQNNYNFLRLFAALCITFSHSFDLLNNSLKEPLYYLTNQRINFSFIGLTIFFSCSGYLIAKSANTSKSLKHFTIKRILRIQPLLFIWCVLAVLVVGTVFTTLSIQNYFLQKQTFAYFRNILPIFGIQFHLPNVFTNNPLESGVNGSLWTLMIEERLYLLMALCFVLKQHKRLVFITLIALYNVVYIGNSFKIIQFNAIDNSENFYALCFLNAALLYFLNIQFVKKVSITLFFVILLTAVSIYFKEVVFGLQVLIIPILIIQIAHLKTPLNKVGYYGDYTYGIYIFSFPIQQILIFTKVANSPFTLFLFTLAIVVPIAMMSWHFFEKKILAFKDKFN